jgi:hypothetical protein
VKKRREIASKVSADAFELRTAQLTERVKILQDRVLARPPTGKEADKAFFDWLSGDE